MMNLKNCLMAIPVVGAIATLNIASPVLAADYIVLKTGLLDAKVSIAELEKFAKTGDASGLPKIVFDLPFVNYLPNLREQLNRPIDIKPNSPIDNNEEFLLNILISDSTNEERIAKLTLMAEKANGKVLINFLKELPGETITPDNFFDSLNAYQPPSIPTPIPTPMPTPTPKSVPEPASTVALLAFIAVFIRMKYKPKTRFIERE